MPLFLRERDVEALLDPSEAIAAVEAVLRALSEDGAGARPTLPLYGGTLLALPAADREAGVAGVWSSVSFGAEGSRAALLLFAADRPELIAVVEAALLARMAAGAVSACAARRLARAAPATLGVIGCGLLASCHVACLRAVLPSLERVVVYCRNSGRLATFCRAHAAEAAEYGRDPAEQDVVVVATSSRDPALRGEWLRPGSLVCAAGATRKEARELDNVVLDRAAFVCCDSLADARVAAGDLIEPVERGVLDWLEVHELAHVVAGDVAGRQSDDDVVLFKSVGRGALYLGVAARALTLAREQGRGEELGP